MNMQHAPAMVLLIVAALALLKSLWILGAPESFRTFADGWLRVVRRVGTLMVVLLVVLAVVLWGLVLFHQPLVNWVLTILGGACIGAAFLYSRPDSLERLARVCLLDRARGVLRLWAAIGMLVSLWLVWIAVRAL